jgi:hypothetical protein
MDCFVSLTLKVPIRPQRTHVLHSYNNTICKTNEGVKHDSYQRFLNKKKACNIIIKSSKPKTPFTLF